MLPLFIALAILTVLSILFFILYPIIRLKSLRNNFLPIYGRGIYKLANKYDYYLINRLKLKGNDDSLINIDHLLLANKYIFVIKDYYFDGKVVGKDEDNSWVYYYGTQKHPQEKLINNPIHQNEFSLNKLSMITGLDKLMLISIILINDDADLELNIKDNEYSYVIKRKDLENLILNIEGRDVAPLNDEQLAYAVRDIASLNLNTK